MTNWKTRYGTNLYDHKGNLKEQGDLDRLTPRQRKRVRKKESRGPETRKERRLRRQTEAAERRARAAERRARAAEREAAFLGSGTTRSVPVVGRGTLRAMEREKVRREGIEKRFKEAGRPIKVPKAERKSDK